MVVFHSLVRHLTLWVTSTWHMLIQLYIVNVFVFGSTFVSEFLIVVYFYISVFLILQFIVLITTTNQWRSSLCTLFGFSIFQCCPWYDSCSWTGKSSGSKNANNTTSTTGSAAIHRSFQGLGGGQIARYQELLPNWDLNKVLFVSVIISMLSKYRGTRL